VALPLQGPTTGVNISNKSLETIDRIYVFSDFSGNAAYLFFTVTTMFSIFCQPQHYTVSD